MILEYQGLIIRLPNNHVKAADLNEDALRQILALGAQLERQAISASMGIVFSDGRDITFQDLYEEADGCLYQVKRTFKGSYHISDRADRVKAD